MSSAQAFAIVRDRIALRTARTNRVTVKVYDARSDDGFEVDVDERRVLDAYRHPFAHAAGELTGEKIDATDRLAA